MTIKGQKATASQVKAAIVSVISRIYIGPSTKQLPRFTVYNNGLPKNVEQHFEKCPCLEALFVPVNQLNEYQSKLQDSASAESIFYAKAKEYFEGVK